MSDNDSNIFQKRVLSFNEAVQLTGLSRSYLRKLCFWKIIPFSKPNGKLVFFDRLKLEEWLLSNPSKGLEERQIEQAILKTTQTRKRRGNKG